MKSNTFKKQKFKAGMLRLTNKVDWAKDIISIFNVRKLIVYIIIMGLFASYFYWAGKKDTPLTIDNSIIAYEKSLTIELDKGEINKLDKPAIRKPPNANAFLYYDIVNKKYGRELKGGALKEFEKKYKPYGFENRLIGVAGVGISRDDVSGESGIGFRYFRLWRIRGELVITDKGFYPISLSYKPDWFFSNTSLNVSGGKAWKTSSNRRMFSINVEF